MSNNQTRAIIMLNEQESASSRHELRVGLREWFDGYSEALASDRMMALYGFDGLNTGLSQIIL